METSSNPVTPTFLLVSAKSTNYSGKPSKIRVLRCFLFAVFVSKMHVL